MGMLHRRCNPSVIRKSRDAYPDNRIQDRRSLSGKKAQCGFTLIELIVVIAIMATLVGLIAPQYLKYVKEQRKATCQRNREALLRIYERALYDGSVDIWLDAGDLDDVVMGVYAPTNHEVTQYLNCPNHSGGGHGYVTGINLATKTAYIECPDCKDQASDPNDVVSIDLLGWSNKEGDYSTDPERDEPESTSTEPEVSDKWTVTFDANGHGTTTSKEVDDGKKVDNPGAPKGAGLYEFEGWYMNPEGTGDKYNFSTPVHSDFTLWAKWKNSISSTVWPYSTDPTWWNEEDLKKYHSDAYISYSFAGKSNDINNERITLKAPSGIFQSKTGALFVLVAQNGSSGVSIKKEQASSPEYYSLNGELKQSLIHLSGQKTVVDISDYSGGQIRVDNLSPGDLVDFVDGDNHYLYVFWHTGNESYTTENISEIKSYNNKLGNMYRVNP